MDGASEAGVHCLHGVLQDVVDAVTVDVVHCVGLDAQLLNDVALGRVYVPQSDVDNVPGSQAGKD